MNICRRLSIEVSYDKYEDMMRILRLLGFDNIYTDNLEKNCVIDVIIRSKDTDYYINRINYFIKEYQSKYDDDFEYRLNISDDDYNFTFEWYYSTLELCSSYKDIAIFLEPMLSDVLNDKNGYENNKAISDYITRILNKKNRYILPIHNNEFILCDTEYMNNFKLNLMIFDSLNINENEDILIYGENKSIYGTILSDIYKCNITLKNTIDYDSDNETYDRILILSDQILSNIRSTLLWSILHVSKSIILGNIRTRKASYYKSQFSDIEYSEYISNGYVSYVFGNIDSSIYTDYNKNGY